MPQHEEKPVPMSAYILKYLNESDEPMLRAFIGARGSSPPMMSTEYAKGLLAELVKDTVPTEVVEATGAAGRIEDGCIAEELFDMAWPTLELPPGSNGFLASPDAITQIRIDGGPWQTVGRTIISIFRDSEVRFRHLRPPGLA